MCVPAVVRLIANCYVPFTYLLTYLLTIRRSACLERPAGDASVDATEQHRVVVGTRADVVLTEHVSPVDVQLAALVRVLVDQLST